MDFVRITSEPKSFLSILERGRRATRAAVEILLARGAKVSLPDDEPWPTPLAWAQKRGHAEIATMLLKRTK